MAGKPFANMDDSNVQCVAKFLNWRNPIFIHWLIIAALYICGVYADKPIMRCVNPYLAALIIRAEVHISEANIMAFMARDQHKAMSHSPLRDGVINLLVRVGQELT